MKFYRTVYLTSIGAILTLGVACIPPQQQRTHRQTVPNQPAATQTPASTKPSAANAPNAPAANAYFNTQYHFTGTIPDGFVVTHESDGPGEIMTMAPQSMSTNSTANISMRAATLGKMSLEQYIDYRITRDLQKTTSVTHWDKFPASYGAYSGFEVLIERQYASGPFKSRLFGFSQGTNVFIVNYSASADQFDLNEKVLEQFVESLTFSS